MASPFSITGRWKGEYSYAPNSPEYVLTAGTSFVLELKQGWFRRFSGTVQDDISKGYCESGSINGRVKFPSISFIKQLPVLRFTTEDGKSETLREALARRGIDHAPEYAHAPLHYRGEFCDEDHAKGEWVLQAVTIYLGDSPIALPEARGSWLMQRD